MITFLSEILDLQDPTLTETQVFTEICSKGEYSKVVVVGVRKPLLFLS